MRLFIVDGIKYHRIGDDDFYGQELFKDQELFGYLSKNMREGRRSRSTTTSSTTRTSSASSPRGSTRAAT